jgi:RHS repeat-associated protein
MNVRAWILALGWFVVALLGSASVASAQTVYLSADSSGQVPGVSFANEDIVAYNMEAEMWSLYFDGSDVGLALNDVDAFELRDDGSILLSLRYSGLVSGVGLVDDSDVLRFVPTSLGTNTSGMFELFFDASDVGLFLSGQDIDALSLAPIEGGHPTPRLVWSIRGSLLSAPDEDLTVFDATSLGSQTSGTSAKYFDGSDVALSLPSEDVSGVSIDPATGEIYLSTSGFYSVPGLSGDSDDVFVCEPTSLGETTACTYRAFFDGDTVGFTEAIDGLHVNPVPVDDVAPTITIVDPANGSTWTERVGLVQITYSDPSPGSGIDQSSFVLTLDGVDVTVNAVVGPTSATYAIVSPLSEGSHELRATVSDEAGNESETVSLFTVDEVALDIAITSPAPLSSVYAQPTTVSGTVTSPIAAVSVNGVQAAVQGGGFVASGVPLTAGVNRIIATATRLSDTDTAEVVAIFDPNGPPQLPPDPATIAPAIDPTVTTSVFAATEFLYQGVDPVQVGVAPGTIEARRVSLVHGQVLTRAGDPLSGVRISVLGHLELGSTYTRTDGRFDLVVNGGGPVTIAYDKFGFASAQRTLSTAWETSIGADPVRMVALDTAVTSVNLSGATSMQVARGTPSVDGDGSRRAMVLFPAGTTASMVMPNGALQPINTLSVRLTEYTVGAAGRQAMPADLPATSAYTYAVELSVDEAIAAGAQQVRFNARVPLYVENFPGLPVGTRVPVGLYDRRRAAWESELDGRVIKIVGVSGGLADVDLNGDGLADGAPQLAALGISADERATLAALYPVGQTLWRARVQHFTPCDLNYPYGGPDADPPLTADRPDGQCEGAGLDGQPGKCAEPESAEEPENDPCRATDRSILECENQVLRENIPLVGASGMALHYRSDRVPGRLAAYTLQIPLVYSQIPGPLKRVDLEVEVAGRTFKQSFSPAANLSTSFTWDGLDAYGRALEGPQPATVRIDYAYDRVFASVDEVNQALNFGGLPTTFTAVATRDEVTYGRTFVDWLGLPAAREQGLGGGWSLSYHHTYDPRRHVLSLGTGERIEDVMPVSIRPYAGTLNTPGSGGDGGPAESASLRSPAGTAVGPEGSLYIADVSDGRVRRVSPDGAISTFAGIGSCPFGPSGDGGPATSACVNAPRSVALGPDGSLFIANGAKVRRVRTDGIIEHFAGANPAFCGQSMEDEGQLATATRMDASHVAVSQDGSVYIADANLCHPAIFRVGIDGRVQTVAGNRPIGISADGVAARTASLGQIGPLALGTDGSVYFWEGGLGTGDRRIRRIRADGLLNTVAGSAQSGFGGDGSPGDMAKLGNSQVEIAVDRFDRVWLADAANHRVRRVDSDGNIQTIFGDGQGGTAGDELRLPAGIGVSPDGSVYVSENGKNIVGKVEPSSPDGFLAGNVRIPSSDGSEVYEFSPQGRHLTTSDGRTGAVLLTFGYDPAGHLVSMTDADGLETEIERDLAGKPTAIVGSFGKRTSLAVNASGDLTSIMSPASQSHVLGYGSGGLLTSLRSPNGFSSTFEHDALGRIVRDTDAVLGEVTLNRVRDGGTATRVVRQSVLGRTRRYDSQELITRDRVRTQLAPNGVVARVQRTSTGVFTSNLPNGVETTRLVAKDPRLGAFAPLSKSIQLTTPGGRALSVTQTRQVAVDSGTGLLQSQLDTTSVNGRSSTVQYNGLTRELLTTSAGGRQMAELLDARGRLLTTRFGTLAPRELAYSSGQMVSMTEGSGPSARQTTFGYGTDGLLATITDPLQRSVVFDRDLAGRITKQTLPGGRDVQYTYDAAGNLASLTPPGRPPHVFRHTAISLEAEYEPPTVQAGDNRTIYEYNLDRQLDLVRRPGGSVIDLNYDTAGRIDAVSIQRGSYSYDHDATSGRLSRVTTPDGGTLEYVHDGDLLTSETWSGSVSGAVQYTYSNDLLRATQSINGGSLVSFGYDADNLLIAAGDLSISRDPQNGLITSTTLGSVTTSQVFSTFGEPDSDDAQAGGVSLFGNVYMRDALGRITRKVETIQGTTTTLDYGYDVAGRLETVRRNGALEATYTYDSNGNRLSRTTPVGTQTGTYDDQDRMLSFGGATFSYTANGDLLSKVDGSGTTTYRYDELGNLLRVDLPTGEVVEYVIDGANRRIGKKVNGVLVQGFLYENPLRIAAELDGSGNVVSRFVYGHRVNVPEYMVRNGLTYRFLTDPIGSVRLVVNATTGAVVQRIDYDEFGNVTSDSNPGWQPFGFSGGLRDASTGLTRFGARDYDPSAGRWTAKDPVLFVGGQSNVYAYVEGDPINRVDPTGLTWTSAARCFATGLAAGAVGALGVGLVAAAAATVLPVAVVTGALGVAAIVGGAYLGADIGSAIADGNYDRLAYDAGALAGGALAGALSGRLAAETINGVKSPPWSWARDVADRYNPSLGNIYEWLGTGTSPASAGASMAAAGAGAAAAANPPCSGCD